jgi:hypothetical protein
VKPLPEKVGPARTSGAGLAFLDVGFGTLRNRLQLNVKNPVLGCGATVNDRFVSLESRRFYDGTSWVRVVSAACCVITWRVISTGRSSTERGGADGSTYRRSRTNNTTIITTVNTTTVNTTAIVCGRVS